jgi:hypothetical protein
LQEMDAESHKPMIFRMKNLFVIKKRYHRSLNILDQGEEILN